MEELITPIFYAGKNIYSKIGFTFALKLKQSLLFMV